MWTLFRFVFLFLVQSPPSYAQNCPVLGPAYPAVADPASAPVLKAAKAKFDGVVARLASNPKFGNGTTSFSIQVFSLHAAEPVYEYHHTASDRSSSLGKGQVGPETLYRIGSISKLVAVYGVLSRLSDKYWNEPVSKYVPELAAADRQQSDFVDNVQWSEVTLGALASQMSGVGRDCMCS